MRICFIAPASNYHTIKWSRWFSSHGHEVHVVSFIDAEIPNTTVHFIDAGVTVKDSDSKKLKYLLHGRDIKRIINKINPDIVNAHYATSYGAVAALSGIKGYILSVWGSDVYDFPLKSPLHKALLKYSLKRAGHIFSTSQAMAEETKKYTDKHIDITPFGVDMELFNPKRKVAADDQFVIGTVKTLDSKYGIDYLLKAGQIIRIQRPDIPLQIRIAGKGPRENEYQDLAKKLEIDDITTWLGFIPQEEAAIEWANMDVAIVPSTLESESFGVSAVEAEACGTPVIISDIPGLMEATSPGITSIVVHRKNAEEIASAVIDLYDNPKKREAIGKAGRQFVIEKYELNTCFEKPYKLFSEYAGGTVDINIFSPQKRIRNSDDFVVGLIKGLDYIYGIDVLLEACALVKQERPEINLKVKIAGKGKDEIGLKDLAAELNLTDCIEWMGFISQERVAYEWANMDIAVVPSRKESFGVSAIEAQACGPPVIISDVAGLMETTYVEAGINIFKIGDSIALKNALLYLHDNKDRATEIALHERNIVQVKFDIDVCFKHIENLMNQYSRTLE